MNDWSAGYVADIDYTYGYYPELNPLRIKMAFLQSGLKFPEVGNACELGFGQGLSVNIHSAATLTEWHGTDFNPSQAWFAQNLAAASGASAHLYDQSFAEFSARQDLPDFDFIALHGIWSWVSDENRSIIVDFVRRKLKVGGVLFISYNTLPGWAPFLSMRHLLTQHAEVMGPNGKGISARIDAALDFAERLLETDPLFARALNGLPERIEKAKEKNRQYLAHEYFNRDWLPMHFATVAEWLEPAKLQFASPARYSDHFDLINLLPKHQELMNAVSDPLFRQTLRDLFVNQQFRCDYWVKGARSLSAREQRDEILKVRVILATPRAGMNFKVNGALGEAEGSEAVYAPVVDYLADHRIHTIGDIFQGVRDRGVHLAHVIEAIMLLISRNTVLLAQDDAAIEIAKPRTDKFNAYLMSLAISSSDIAYLSSPVTGGGIYVSRFLQLFLLAMLDGHKSKADIARFVWSILERQGQYILKDGKPLESAAESIKDLEDQVDSFLQLQLPVLQSLKIA